ncbi:MAG: hypothetical protein V5A52_06845 [Halovenus sp.]
MQRRRSQHGIASSDGGATPGSQSAVVSERNAAAGANLRNGE